MVVATYGAALAQARYPALVMWPGVLVVRLCLGPSAGRKGACLVEHPGEVPESDPGVVPGGLVAMITRAVERFEVDDQVLAAGVPGEGGGVEPPPAERTC